MPKQSDLAAFLIALAVTSAIAAGLVYFVRELWPILPPWLSMIVFILLAVAVIGYPIYALAQWSNRYLGRKGTGKSPTSKASRERSRSDRG